jgi:hypothetical protein
MCGKNPAGPVASRRSHPPREETRPGARTEVSPTANPSTSGTPPDASLIPGRGPVWLDRNEGARRGGTASRWLIGILGAAILAYSGFLLMRLAGSLRSLGGDSMVLPRGGPGLWVVAAGGILAFATLFLPASSQRIYHGFRRRGSDRGSPNDGSTLFSKRVMAQIRSPARARTNRPVPWRMPVGARR